MIPLYLIIILIFGILIILTLLSTLAYYIFFKKSQVVVFGNNNIPNTIMLGKKKDNRIWLKGNANFEITNNYVQYGKKRIFFCQKDDENTYKPYIPPELREKVNYNLNAAIADSFEKGAKRFKFGLEKYSALITITIVAVMCIIGTIMVVKYNTQMTPVQSEFFDEMGKTLNEVSKTNLELNKQVIAQREKIDTIAINNNNDNPPPR